MLACDLFTITERMMGKNSSIDKRSARTRAAIYDAFVDLIEQKGFDAISITDITRKAKVNRSTFYLHFKDKLDLVIQMQAEIIQDFETILFQTLAMNIADINKLDAPLPVVVSLFSYFKEHAKVISALLELKGEISFQAQLKKTIQKNISLGFLSGIKSISFSVPSEYLISYAISAHLGVVQVWLKNGCIETPEEMAMILSRLSINGPFRAIEIQFDNGKT